MRSGLFVGVSNYNDENIRNLRFADRDASRIRKQLTVTSGLESWSTFTSSAQDNDIKRSYKENILAELQRYEKGEQLELFFFFFSGHGFRSSTGRDYLVPQNATSAALTDTSLSLDDIIRRCCRIDAQQTIIAIDACRSEFSETINVEKFSPSISTQMLSDQNLAIFFSTDAETKSYESQKFSSGLFAEAFHQSLELEHDCIQVYDLSLKVEQLLSGIRQQASKPHQASKAYFFGSDAKKFALPISKIESQLGLPAFVRAEVRRDQEPKTDGDYRGDVIIDFGTTKSVLAYFDAGEVKFAKDQFGNVCIPSTIKFESDGRYLIGLDHFSGVSSKYSKREIIEIELENETAVGEISAEQSAMLIIKSLKRNFEGATKKIARSCVLSVPADYNINEVSAIVRATQATGLRVTRIVPEPTAAAMNILRKFGETGNTLDSAAIVVDLGGGTLDIAFVTAAIDVHEEQLKAEESELQDMRQGPDVLGSPDTSPAVHQFDSKKTINVAFTILASAGDAKLGGIDFNEILRRIFLKKIEDEVGLNAGEIYTLRTDSVDREVERAKLELSENRHTHLHLPDVELPSGDIETLKIRISRKEVEKAAGELTDRFKKCVEHCIEHGVLSSDFMHIADDRAGNPQESIVPSSFVDTAIIAGQAGLWPPIREHLRKRFPYAEQIVRDPDTAVARGLANWVYSPKYSLSITDIAHTYIGIGSVFSSENTIFTCQGGQNYELIYPTDVVPNWYQRLINWSQLPQLQITTHTVGKPPQEVCRIEVSSERIKGTEGFIYVYLDKSLTAVVELRDMFGHVVSWQINNFFRLPDGFSSVGTIFQSSVPYREVRSNSRLGKKEYDLLP